MRTIYKLALPCAALITHPVAAQTTAAPVAPVQTAVVASAATILPAARPDIMRAGLAVALVTREELTTKKKKLRVGQRFQMEVAENITQNGVVVIPSGTPAIGEITEVRNKGMWGKSGYIGARVVSLNLNGRNVRLSGTFDDKGVTGTGGVVAAIALVPIAGFLTTGTSAFIASGSAVKGFLDEDLAFQAVQPQVISVPAAVPAVAPAPAVLTTASVTK
ncbi:MULTISPECIES: hypothetical protein [Novosphingobium]|uniref:hypothetical protein n=1 Tax=Novosphingobium TaxID=165696 RepID=UPI002329F3DF|nr:hypothetical protein [Novosphingobium resinovorum]GLK44444.1 hypothetical protein GCM10017612_23640 [Novosphingobium resinovorum]